MTHYKHWQDVPIRYWCWENFTPKEIASKGDGSIIVDEYALDCLQAARFNLNRPFHINSAYRDVTYNRQVGGGVRSQHLKGKAFDISTKNHNPKALYKACLVAGFTGFGFYETFLHVDTGPKRWWGKKFKHLFIDEGETT